MKPKVMWKFKLPDFACKIELPLRAQIREFMYQGDSFYVWAECYPDVPTESRSFQIIGTGQEVPKSEGVYGHYHGTVHSGQYVWHLYELTN